ncbi:MAG: phosphoenolpyruvate carboxylase, partial [Alphaproteobacteria bacterium]
AQDIEKTRAFAQLSVTRNPRRKALIGELHEALNGLAAAAARAGRGPALALFAARLDSNGFGVSHVHFRLNAAQLHNAVRPAVAMETSPDASSNRRRYLGALGELLAGVRPVTVNYGSLMRERTTARRMFMLIAQILKFVDDTAPVRLLIAESDTPFTVLAALYYAKLFGIEDKVEICPLFETDAGLERGAKVIDELLDEPHYRAYVARQRRLCVQTGYSDAGRYMGQIAAGLAIERFRIKLGQLWSRHDLSDVELVIFDTHGESVGRGAHPDGIAARLDYVHTARARAVFAQNRIRYKQELSLQGGDGYVWLWTAKLARATMARMLTRAVLGPETDAHDDPFYIDTDYSLDFFLTLKEFQGRTVHDPDYLPMLTGFGVNMLYPSGSRMTLRQSERGTVTRASHVAQIRAIPHNAILQQMGYLANTLGGMGTAIAKDADSYTAVRDRSPRLQQLRAMVRHAARFSDLRVFEGYLTLFDPEYWLHYAAAEKGQKRRERMQRLSGHLARMSVDVDHGRVIRAFWRDRNDLTGAMGGNVPSMAEDDGEALILVHVLRLALIQQLFLLAARIPRFSSRPNLTIEEVIEQLLRLDVVRALAILREIFPIEPDADIDGSFGEPASYMGDASRGYAYENRVLFDQIERIHDLIRRLGLAVVHHIGAYG